MQSYLEEERCGKGRFSADVGQFSNIVSYTKLNCEFEIAILTPARTLHTQC